MSDRIRWIVGVVCIVLGTCGLVSEHLDGFDLSGWWHTDGETAEVASVVIFYDSESLDAGFAEKHPGQLAAMRSTAEGSLIDFCQKNNVEFRLLDKRFNAADALPKDLPAIQNVAARPHASYPSLTITPLSGHGYDGPMPEAEADNVAKAKKILGGK